jgi:hypothetical protein
MKKIVSLILIILHIALWLKLNIFFQQLSGTTPLLDFDESYWGMARQIMDGVPLYKAEGMVTLGPPLVIAPYFLFVLFPLQLSRQIITFLSLIAGYLLSFRLGKKYFPQWWVQVGLGISLILFSSFPARLSLGLGQPNIICAWLITELMINSRDKLKGVSLAWLSIFKTYWIFSVVIFLKRKHIDIVKSFFTTMIVIFLATLPFIKVEAYQEFLINRVGKLTQFGIPPTPHDYYNQSVVTSLWRFGLSPLWVEGVGKLVVLLILAASMWFGYKHNKVTLILIGSLLASPVLWQHYLIALAPVWFVLGISSWKQKWWGLWLISLMLAWVEFPWIHQAQPNLVIAWLASHYFISLVLLWLVSLSSIFNHQSIQKGK